MKRSAAYVLTLLAMMILALTGQSLLLIPDRLAELSARLPPWFGLAAGAALIAINIYGTTTILIGYRQLVLQSTNALMALASGGLAFLYARAGMAVEAGLLAAIALGQFLLIVEGLRKRPLLNEPIFAVSALASLAAAVWLAVTRLAGISSWKTIDPWTLLMAAGFLAAAGLSAYATFARPRPLVRLLGKLSLLAWLPWIFFFSRENGLASWIPSLSLALGLSLVGWVHWERIVLPPNNLLGRRFITAVDSLIVLMLGGLTMLVHLSDPLNNELLREVAFILSLSIAALMTLVLIVVNMTINGLLAVLGAPDPSEVQSDTTPLPTGQSLLIRMVGRYLEPFSSSQQDLLTRARIQERQLLSLSGQLEAERRHSSQLGLLIELDQQLENRLDPPVAAQLAVNTLQRALNCGLVTILMYEPERREFVALATANRPPLSIPPGYRQNAQQGLIGRAARLRKTQVVNDTRLDPDHFNLAQHTFLSEVVVPLIQHGHLQGMLVVDDERVHAFPLSDVQLIETAASVLLRGWERSNYAQRLTELIQAGITLSSASDPHTAIKEIAEIARHTLQARFIFVTLLDQDQNLTRTAMSGYAPSLARSLGQNPREDNLIQAALNAGQTLRVRDIRKYDQAAHLRVDHEGLRSLLAMPIRLRRMTIGAILAFGKLGEIAFTESDESLASLLASQAGAAVESAWLVQQLRNTIKITSLLHELSIAIIQAEALHEAARAIAEKTYTWTGAAAAGIVLFTAEHKIEAEMAIDESGAHAGARHPLDMIEQTLNTGQSMFISQEDGQLRICLPLHTPRRRYGALWLDVTEEEHSGSRITTSLETLCNQAAIALERAILLRETRQQALALEDAYQELETTYDQTLTALMSALDARDRETEGHSTRVSQLACLLGEELGLSQAQLKMLERGSLLHDIGKIGISDVILHKPGPLSEEEWKIMRLHPEIGARIVEDIPFLRETLPIIRYHQERWDGSGYPQGMRGATIPTSARIFAVVDSFDALTNSRPYRDKISVEEALKYLRANSGVLFDPEIVNLLDDLNKQQRLDYLLEME